MKCTEYFKYTRLRADRAFIQIEWIMFVISNFEKEEVQDDGRIRRWAHIKTENKFLRVVLLPDGETVHNAFFDRDYRRDTK